MRWNLFCATVVITGLLLASASVAQESTVPAGNTPELRKSRALLKFGREDIVREEMRLSEKEAAAFWPLYDRYEAEMLVVRDRYADLLTSYTAAYRAGTVTVEQATELVETYFDIEQDLLDIKRKYFSKFRKALPSRKAARFYQLENKMKIEMEYQLSQIIPLIDPV
jgi:hypothetical protein